MHYFTWKLELVSNILWMVVATPVMCPGSFISLTSLHQLIFKPIRIFAVVKLLRWSNFYQLHQLILTLRNHEIMIFEGVNVKLASENFFWKWISRTEGENDKMGIPKSRKRSRLNYHIFSNVDNLKLKGNKKFKNFEDLKGNWWHIFSI